MRCVANTFKSCGGLLVLGMLASCLRCCLCYMTMTFSEGAGPRSCRIGCFHFLAIWRTRLLNQAKVSLELLFFARVINYVQLLFMFSCLSRLFNGWEARGLDLVGLKPNPWDPISLQCFDTVGWVI